MLVDSIADTAWCGGVVLGGNPVRLNDIDIRRIGGSLSINGEIIEILSGSGYSAVVGDVEFHHNILMRLPG